MRMMDEDDGKRSWMTMMRMTRMMRMMVMVKKMKANRKKHEEARALGQF